MITANHGLNGNKIGGTVAVGTTRVSNGGIITKRFELQRLVTLRHCSPSINYVNNRLSPFFTTAAGLPPPNSPGTLVYPHYSGIAAD